MNVRVPLDALGALADGGDVTLEGETRHYVFRVLRLVDGDSFVAFEPKSAQEADGHVIDAARGLVHLDKPVAARVTGDREILWIQGGAKGEKMDAVVRDATELGVTRFAGASTERSILRLSGDRAEERVKRWARIAREAARQCGRGDAPVVEGWCRWDEALQLASPAAARFCPWEGATESLGPHLQKALLDKCALSFAVGPEGGLTEDEARTAEMSGYRLVSLGPFVLRTETVAAAVLGAVRIFADVTRS